MSEPTRYSIDIVEPHRSLQTCHVLQQAIDPSGDWVRYEDVAALAAQLAECYRLTGADPDGNEDWRLARDAVDEVRRLRADADNDAALLDQCRSERNALETQLAEAQRDTEREKLRAEIAITRIEQLQAEATALREALATVGIRDAFRAGFLATVDRESGGWSFDGPSAADREPEAWDAWKVAGFPKAEAALGGQPPTGGQP